MEKPIYKRTWFIAVVSLFVLFFILGKLVEPSKEDLQKKATADSLQAIKDLAIKATQDSIAKTQRDSAEKAFAMLPKKEQQRILKERAEEQLRFAEERLRSDMETILADNQQNFHIQYIAEQFIKNKLKNPDSYDKVDISKPEIVMANGMAGFRVLLTYKATNSFGATIQERKYVIVEKTGKEAVLALDPR